MNPAKLRRQDKYRYYAIRLLSICIGLCLLFNFNESIARQNQPSGDAAGYNFRDTIVTEKDTVKPRDTLSIPRIPNNIVFLLDVSNSMARDKKMPLLHKCMRILLNNLRAIDRVHLITFGNTVNEIYSTTSLTTPDSLSRILEKIRSTASATNVNGGIQDSYDLIRKYFIKNGNNEVFIITDGEFSLNKFTIELVNENPEVLLTAVIVGKGSTAEYAANYVRETLKLPVVTLMDESTDAEQLLKHIREIGEYRR